MTRRFPLHTHISTLFIVLTLIVGGIVGWLGHSAASGILKKSAIEISTRIGSNTESAFSQIIVPAEMATRLLSFDGLALATSLEERLTSTGQLCEALKNSEALSSLYFGYGTGDFFMLRRMWDEADRKFFNAPANTAYVVQSIDHPNGEIRGRYMYLDATLQVLGTEDRPDYAASFDPRTRDWYKNAMASDGQIKTPPYLFHTTGKIGSTIANRTTRGEAVVGADIRLDTLDQSLARQKVTPGTEIVIANVEGLTLAYEDMGKAVHMPTESGGNPVHARIGELSPVFQELAPVLKGMDTSSTFSQSLTVAGKLWHASIYPVHLEGAKPLYLISAIPDSELMTDANALLHKSGVAVVIVILLSIPLTWFLARVISRALRKLDSEADAIRRFDFSQPIAVRSLILEVDDLSSTMDSMKRTIRRFLEISQAIAGEHNFDSLLPRLLSETLSAAEGEAGILYLADKDVMTPATALLSDGTPWSGKPATVTATTAGPLLGAALADGHAHSGPLAAADREALNLGTNGATHAIAVPLINRQRIRVGAMLLLRHEHVGQDRLSFIEALAGSTAISLENKELIHAQKLLFEAMIQLIAGAIDAKSPYTGGHCARVPELTKMLARAACSAQSGPFAGFALSDEEWESVHVAAWLHDCGKVTTPEYVVDKATKLETLYDRIHEIRMRFEVLKRDAEIACLKAIAGGAPEADSRARLAGEQRQLDEDFAFIAECNEGGEFMAPHKLDRLAAIAARTWLRTLDDRIGISHEEKERKARAPAQELPVVERLLADKPEHIFNRSPQDRMPPDNRWGFRMPVPDLLYNKGELYNLGVARGTLSEEERYKINEHIVQTLIMLTQLPFPKHLRDVPEFAACHHEKMDGTGYPRRLMREQMGPVARMMAIADIFEALTAVDRPYKKGKTLSEALRIMARMRDDQHIDPDLFELFLSSGVWRDYAERFLRPEQIDAVDLASFAGASA